MKCVLLLTLCLSAAAFAAEPGTATVTGDRVSLRAAPSLSGVLLSRVMSGDTLKVKDNARPGWVGVQPPADVNLWVHSDYVDGKTVTADELNVRSGPSLNHSVVGVVTNGDVLNVRGKLAAWVRIAPVDSTTAWISRDFVDVEMPEPVEPPEPVDPPEAEVSVDEAAVEEVVVLDETDVVEPVPLESEIIEPTVEQVMTAASNTVEQALKPDPAKEQGFLGIYSGILRPARGLLYKLINPADGAVVCYVRGNSAQMETYATLPLKLTGKIYWARGLDLPIIVPSQLEVLDVE